MKRQTNIMIQITAKIVLFVMFTFPAYLIFAAAPEAPAAPEKPVYSQVTPVAPTSPPAPGEDAAQTPAEVVTPSVTPVVMEIEYSGDKTEEVVEGVANLDPNDPSPEVKSLALTEGKETKNSDTTSETNITNNNLADVENTVNLTADSGGNTASYNTGNGQVTSGDANVFLSILNLINTVFISPEGGQIGLLVGNILGDLIGDYIVGPAGEMYSLTGSRLDVGNTNTGASSDNSASVNIGNDTIINNINDVLLNNNIAIDANTGGNQASYNTGNGNVASGDANVSLNLLNFLNSTFYAENNGLIGILNIFGDFVGNLVIPSILAGNTTTGGGSLDVVVKNENTGADSTNDATLNLENSMDIYNDNTSAVSNDIALDGNSGGNVAGYNTGRGSVSTGNVDADLNVATTANQNIFGENIFYALINVMGEWTGSNILASLFRTIVLRNEDGSGQTILVTNVNTGANSENTANVNLSNDTEVNNINNAALSNDVDIQANTGNNEASYNTGNGSVSSGNVNILANIFNLANLNVVAKKFTFFVVNIFGDWNGDISDHGTDKVNVATNSTDTSTSTSNSGNVPVNVVTSPAYSFFSYTKRLGSDERLVLASVDKPLSTEVLAANTGDNSYFYERPEMGDENTLVHFMRNNLWNIFIVLGIGMIAWAAFLYEKQRSSSTHIFL